MSSVKATSIDEYIAGFPAEVQLIMQQVRSTINNMVPEAEETISYAIPCFKLHNEYLVYFAGFAKHIGVYPAPTGNPEFTTAFQGYKTGKGSIQFPLDKPIPFDLIKKIVDFRLRETEARIMKKGKAR